MPGLFLMPGMCCGCGPPQLPCTPCNLPVSDLILSVGGISYTFAYHATSSTICGVAVTDWWNVCTGPWTFTGPLGDSTWYIPFTMFCNPNVSDTITSMFGWGGSTPGCTGTFSGIVGCGGSGGSIIALIDHTCSPLHLHWRDPSGNLLVATGSTDFYVDQP